MGASDGDRLREIDVVAPPLVPFLYREQVRRARQRTGVGRYASGTNETRIPGERQPFGSVVITNRTAVAVVPRSKFRRFLELAGADAQGREDLSIRMSLQRKRRGSNQHLQVLAD
jgi:hypothetical protein